MSTKSILPDISGMLRRTPGLAEIQNLVDQFSLPTCLYDIKSNSIILSNYEVSQLTAYTQDELQKLKISNLISNWGNLNLLNKSQSITDEVLIQRSGIQTPISLTFTKLGHQESWGLLSFQSKAKLHKNENEEGLEYEQWDSIHKLVSATLENNKEKGLLKILQAGQLLTGASFLALYFQSSTNNLSLGIRCGTSDFLPETISESDISNLNTFYTWSKGKKSLSKIHQKALLNKVNFISSIPLEKGYPENGIIVIGNQISEPSNNLEGMLSIIGHTVYAFEQTESIISKLSNKIDLQTQYLNVNQTVKDNVNDGIIFVDSNLIIKDINPVAETILGYTKHEVKDNPLEKILIGSSSIIPIIKSISVQEPTLQNLGNIKIHRRDGKSLTANIRAIPIHNGEYTNQIAILISDMSKDEAFKIKTRQLEQQALLGEVTAIFAHEVRNPINNISTGLQVMEMNLSESDPLKAQIDRMKKDCDRLTDLMSSVLSFSGPREFKMEPINIGVLLENLLERWRPRMERMNISFHVQITDNVPKTMGDHRALEQVFTNFISNAIQAMKKEGGTLTIKISPDKSSDSSNLINIDISDTGMGIPDEIKDKIFEPFFTTHQEGTGLGLAITQRIISAHRGHISLDSFPGGTVFHIKLPSALPIGQI